MIHNLVHLDEFPDWLNKRLSKIKAINSNLKKIAKEKQIRHASMFQNKKKKEKKIVQDVVLGPRDDDIGISVTSKTETLIL